MGTEGHRSCTCRHNPQPDLGGVDLVALSGKVRTTVPTRGPKPIYSVLQVMYSLARTELATSVGRWALSRMRRSRLRTAISGSAERAARALARCRASRARKGSTGNG